MESMRFYEGILILMKTHCDDIVMKANELKSNITWDEEKALRDIESIRNSLTILERYVKDDRF